MILTLLAVASAALARTPDGESNAARVLLAEGDAHYARRAEGATAGRALSGPADAAIAAYRRALAADPESLPARAGLMRALFFRSAFCDTRPEERKLLLEEAKRVGEQGVIGLERRIGRPRPQARIGALRSVPDAVALYFWSAVSWGEWALARGSFAAARQGAGGRIRDLGQTVVDLDPAYQQGGGYRILGRLHDRSPKILFVTGWVSRDKALDYLRQALAVGPLNSVNQFFLAEAILAHDRSRAAEARRLLEQCASSPPRPEFLVEDAFYAEQSRARLAALAHAGP